MRKTLTLDMINIGQMQFYHPNLSTPVQINPHTHTFLWYIWPFTTFLSSPTRGPNVPNMVFQQRRECDVDAEEEVEHSEKIQHCPDPSCMASGILGSQRFMTQNWGYIPCTVMYTIRDCYCIRIYIYSI